VATLALSATVSVAFISTVLLNCAGVFVAELTGRVGDAAILLGFYAVVFLAFFFTIRAAIKRRRFDYAYLALAVQVLTYAVLWTGVLQRRVESWNFNSRLARRSEVVELAQQGKFQPRLNGPCDCFYADLPKKYANLSAGGEVLVSHHSGGLSVTFFVTREAMWSDDDYSAFIFRADDNEPRTGEEDTERFYEIRPLRPHWYFARHT
jgi:hypothetical protein